MRKQHRAVELNLTVFIKKYIQRFWVDLSNPESHVIECPETPELERSCPPPNDQSVFLTERSSGLPLDSILGDIVSTGGQVSTLSGDGREEACLHVDYGGVANVYECLVNSGGYAFAVCQVN